MVSSSFPCVQLNFLDYPDIETIVPEDSPGNILAFPFPKGSELKPTFDHFLAKSSFNLVT